MGYREPEETREDHHAKLAIVILLFLLLLLSLAPLALPAPTVGYLSYWMSGAGLLISVFGFGFTLLQLKKTQGTAAAAKDAAEKMRAGLGSLDALSDFQEVRTGIEAAQAELQNRIWSRARVSCNRVRQSLNRVVAMPDVLTVEESELVKDAIADTHRIIGELNGAGADESEFEYRLLSEKLTEIDSLSVQTETKVRGRFSVQ